MPLLPPHPVVVVTGASSGIGRATALAFAEQGARLVVAGRREQPLRRLAEECVARGGEALAVPADVTDADAVVRLAAQAAGRWGRLDVWVNNAAVNAFAHFGDEPVDVPRRVLEVNALGQLHGARAALPLFRDQGRGVLVNVGSVLSRIPSPYQASYVMSKQRRAGPVRLPAAGAAGRTGCAGVHRAAGCGRHPPVRRRGELDRMGPGPAASHLRAGAGGGGGPLVRPPAAGRGRRRSGRQGHGAAVGARAAAHGAGHRAAVRRSHFQDAYAAHSPGNLFDPGRSGSTVRGGWKDGGTTALARKVALAGAAVLLPSFVGRRRR